LYGTNAGYKEYHEQWEKEKMAEEQSALRKEA
jgi:hypothetical protein